MQADSDTELLTRWRAGDREAYAVLVARHHGLVRAACLRQAAPGEGEDCTQAVFLILARRPVSADRAPVLAAWLLRVAWFVCRNSRRDAQRRRQAERAAAQTSGQQAAVRPEALDHLDTCLQKLPGKQREAVSLHYLAGLTPEEVATALGTTRANAYQLISRGLAGMRELLARRGVAVTSAGLLALFAGEAQAATAATAANILANLTPTPSAGAVSLAKGAMTAMTITSLTPYAAAAGLVLATGALTLALSAEPGTAPGAVAPVIAPVPTVGPAVPAAEAAPTPTAIPPVSAPAVGPASAPRLSSGQKAPSHLTAEQNKKALEMNKKITFDFQDQDLFNAIAMIKQLSGLEIELALERAISATGLNDFAFDPKAALPTVTLKVKDMGVLQALAQIEMLTGYSHVITDSGTYRIMKSMAKPAEAKP